MSFEVKHGDLFANVTAGHIVHGCNAQGVMGSGFAKLVRDKYPEAYKAYVARHCETPLHLGEVISIQVAPNLVIHNAITQEFYGTEKRQVYYPAVHETLRKVTLAPPERDPLHPVIECTDVHFPLIGGGLAGGDKDILMDLFKRVFLWTEVKGTLWIYP
jgi:O-acetyl-ADP-ribose deacetylase (regulator of RNase III)